MHFPPWEVQTPNPLRCITMFDQFFDCFNVSRTQKGLHSRKPALEPYRSPNDWRFEASVTLEGKCFDLQTPSSSDPTPNERTKLGRGIIHIKHISRV